MEIEFAAEIEMVFLLIAIAFSFLISGWLVDIVKNKTRFFNILLLICVFGLFLNIFSEALFDFIGLIIVLITIPPLFVLWFTTLVHETTILNRGRITAIILISCFLLGLIGIAFAMFEFLFKSLFIVESFLLICIVWNTRTYKYVETEERLKSDEKFKKIIFEKHFFRYSSSLTLLSFILGVLLEQYGFDIDIITFSIASFLYLIAAGCFLDYVGRKYAMVIGILVLSFFLISYGSFTGEEIVFIYGFPKRIFLSLHYAFSILPILLTIFTVSGDFSTERGNIKYRGRINGLFMSLLFVGVITGVLFSQGINALYNAFPVLNDWIPDFPGRMNAYLLIIILVWMMAMKEILISKETKWASTIKFLYVFSKDGVCLYSQNFERKKQPKDENQHQLDEDLIAGGLSGVLTIITEITRSKKNLRIISKEGVKLMFSYGKYHIAALISTMDLPVLMKKLDEFSREFEHKFSNELKNFAGYVNPFKPAKYIVKKYFIQKYELFVE